jgi:hypothetical protein
MFNAYVYNSITQKNKTEELRQTKHLKSISAQLQFREKLAKNNRKRIEKRVIEMSKNPIPVNLNEVSVAISEFKGESFIRHRPKDKQERLKDAEIKNTWLDTVPILPSPHNFRPRFKSKEVNPSMHFRPRDRYERVAEAWESQKNIINTSWEVKTTDNKSKSIGSKQFPNTLKKSFYKTLESVALDLIPSIKSSTLPQPIPNPIETLNTERKLSDLAKQAMEKCKLRPLKEEMRSVYTGRSSADKNEVKILIKKIGN